MDVAVAQFEDLKSGSRSQDIEQAKANVTAAAAQLNKAKKDFQRAEALYKQNLIPASQLDAARSAYDAAAAQQKAVVERLSLVKEGPTKESLQAPNIASPKRKPHCRFLRSALRIPSFMLRWMGDLEEKRRTWRNYRPGDAIYTIGDLENPGSRSM